MRDRTYDEDHSQVRKNSAPQVMASLRNIVMGLYSLAGSTFSQQGASGIVSGALAVDIRAVIPTIAIPIGTAGQTWTGVQAGAAGGIAVGIVDFATHVAAVACIDESGAA